MVGGGGIVRWKSYKLDLCWTEMKGVGWDSNLKCCLWDLLLYFEKGLVWMKLDSFEERTIALMVALCPPWGWCTEDRSSLFPWGKQPKHDSRPRSAFAVTG